MTPDLVVQFRRCTVELHSEQQIVITRFPDGTEAHACPHDTPEYHAHALEKTGLDDVMRYAWQHDLMHVICAEMAGHVSPVLWRLAHGLEPNTPECEAEEVEAQKLQRAFQMRW